MRCLDVGSRDGFYAFHMERLGAAEVVSLDLDDPDQIHFPGPRPPREWVQRSIDDGNAAFAAAREALGSSVVRSHASVYELGEADHGRFDFAVIGTLLHHLRDPLRALSAVRGVLDGRLLVNDGVIPGLDSLRRRPMAEMLVIDAPFWLMPNPAGLHRMIQASGFTVLDGSRPYLIPFGAGAQPPTVRQCLSRPFRNVPGRLIARRGSLHVWILAEPAG